MKGKGTITSFFGKKSNDKKPESVSDAAESSKRKRVEEEKPVSTSVLQTDEEEDPIIVRNSSVKKQKVEEQEENNNRNNMDDEEEDIEEEHEEEAISRKPSLSTTSGYESDDEEDEIAEDEDESDVTEKSGTTSTTKKSSKAPTFAYEKFDPNQETSWKTGTSTPYLFLAKTLEEISKTTSRIKITEILCNCFRTILAKNSKDLLPAVYLSVNKIAPAHMGIELGIGEGLLLKSIAEATGKQVKQIKQMFSREGDLGLVAQQSRATQKTMFQPKSLTVDQVFKEFKFIAVEQGKKSQQKKMDKIKLLLVSCKGCEPQFIIRSLEGKLRIGLGEETVLVALAHSILIHKNGNKVPASSDLAEAAEKLKQTYCELPVYEDIITALLEKSKKKNPFDDLSEFCHLTAGIPVRPMLAKAAKDYSEIFDRFSNTRFTCEWKYDGERAQIHMRPGDKSIHIYSRNLENHTPKYPDIIEFLPKAFVDSAKVESFIIDCEVVAYDRETKKIKPFQILTTRGRKNIKMEDIKVHICLFAFDLLYLNGKSYLRETLDERRKALTSAFKEVDGYFKFATHMDTKDIEQIKVFLKDSVAGNCEGLMVKTLEKEGSTYEPSKRSMFWLKLKKDYLQGLGDSLDLVPIGGYLGKGKRVGHYGGFLLACYDPDTEEYQSICKVGTGFSDEKFETLSKELDKHKLAKPKSYYKYAESLKPDVFFDCVQVWEVLAADLTLSPAHFAAIGKVDDSKGISIRFPRFIRVREDKPCEEATTADQIVDFFLKQANHAKK